MSACAYLTALLSVLGTILGFLVVGGLLCWRIASTEPEDLNAWYGGLFDPVVGIGTFIVAVGVWVRTARTRWENSLPQGLDVTILAPHNGSMITFLQARTLPLTDPSDIRQTTQQVLSSWNGAHFSGLGLNFTVTTGRPVRREKKWIRLWECEYPLKSLPAGECDAGCDPVPNHPHAWTINPFQTSVGQTCTKKQETA